MFKNISRKRIIITLACILLFIALSILIVVFTPITIPSDSDDMISFYTRNKPNVKLSVSVITPDETNITVYGHDGRVKEKDNTVYELGGVTKTFTGALTARAVLNGELSLTTSVKDVLPVPIAVYVPTIGDLVTQTSAYADFTPEKFGKKLNPYSGMNDFDVLMAMGEFNPTYDGPYIYSDSDYGISILGTALGDLYSESFITVLNDFIHMDLGLRNTYVATGSDKPSHGYKWLVSDAYIASSGLTSTIDDMTNYLKMILNQSIDYFKLALSPLKEINEENEVGYLWIISKSSGVAGSYGQTSHYSSAILVDIDSGYGVVVLSNYPDDSYGSVYEIANKLMSDLHG